MWRRIAKLAGFFLITIVAVVLISASKFKSVESRAQFLHEHQGVTKLLPVYWQMRKLGDIIYLPYFFKHDAVPTYALEIAPQDLEKLNASLPQAFMGVSLREHVFVPAIFRADGKTYQTTVRYRGERARHWNASKKSYLVKFDKKTPFHDQSEISFIIPDDRNFAVEDFNNYRAGKLGLHTPDSGFANLDVNHQGSALYFAIESWSRQMLDKWSVSPDSIFYGNSNGGAGLWQDINNWQVTVSASKGDKDDLSKLEELLRLLNTAPDREFNTRIFELVDKDNFYALQIHQELANSSHQFDDNVRLYYDARRSKFFFVPWDVEIEPLGHNHFGQYGQLAGRIFSNPTFLKEKNERLYKYVSNENNLADDLNFYDYTYESFKISLYKDRLKIYTNHYADKSYAQHRQEIIDIFHYLQGHLVGSDSAPGLDVVRLGKVLTSG